MDLDDHPELGKVCLYQVKAAQKSTGIPKEAYDALEWLEKSPGSQSFIFPHTNRQKNTVENTASVRFLGKKRAFFQSNSSLDLFALRDLNISLSFKSQSVPMLATRVFSKYFLFYSTSRCLSGNVIPINYNCDVSRSISGILA